MDIKFSNNASTYLIKAINDTDTEISIVPDTVRLFPELSHPSDFYMLTLSDTNANIEILKVTSVDAVQSILTVVRGQEGTIPTSFPINSLVEHRLTAGSLEHILNAADATNTLAGRIRVASEEEFTEGVVSDACVTPSLNHLHVLPIGSVIMYAGPVSVDGFLTTRDGVENKTWANCDGRNGTIDLRNSFPMAASTDYPLHSTGGSNEDITISIPETTGEHVLTVAEMPAHAHGVGSNGYFQSGPWLEPRTPGPSTNRMSTTVGENKGHSHTLDIDDVVIDGRPQFYALTFVQKIK